MTESPLSSSSADLLGTARLSGTIEPLREMAAWEALWSEHGASVKTIAERFRAEPGRLPSELVSAIVVDETTSWIRESVLGGKRPFRPKIRLHGQGDYPEKLRDAVYPVELLYYLGDWSLAFTPSVAVVGARKVSEDGKRRCSKLVRALVDEGYTIVSGLAAGVDAVAHRTCIEQGGRTIAVLGTPLNKVYPSEHRALQTRIAAEHLLVSQVPFKRYGEQHYRVNSRTFFPERNVTMSALSDATVIVEASETSGTLHQARAAIRQGRKLFILNSCFEHPALTWPARFEKQGAIRVQGVEDVLRALPPVKPPPAGLIPPDDGARPDSGHMEGARPDRNA